MKWENRDLLTGITLASGTVNADGNGLVTLPQITVTQGRNRVVIYR